MNEDINENKKYNKYLIKVLKNYIFLSYLIILKIYIFN